MNRCISNPKLVEAHKGLVKYFNKKQIAFDPWWWPLNDGSSLLDYGIKSDQNSTFTNSLLLNSIEEELIGFRGSLGALKGCAMIITTRPSTGQFQKKGLNTILELLKPSMTQTNWPNIHLTDLVKFRGAGGDAAFDRGITLEMWQESLNCLRKEIEILKPTVVYVSKGAANAIKPWLIPQSRVGGFGRWRSQIGSLNTQLMDFLIKSPQMYSMTPRHFGGKEEAKLAQRRTVNAYKKHPLWPKYI